MLLFSSSLLCSPSYNILFCSSPRLFITPSLLICFRLMCSPSFPYFCPYYSYLRCLFFPSCYLPFALASSSVSHYAFITLICLSPRCFFAAAILISSSYPVLCFVLSRASAFLLLFSSARCLFTSSGLLLFFLSSLLLFYSCALVTVLSFLLLLSFCPILPEPARRVNGALQALVPIWRPVGRHAAFREAAAALFAAAEGKVRDACRKASVAVLAGDRRGRSLRAC